MHTSPAVKVWEGTDIDALKVHLILDGRAACNAKLIAMFVDTGYAVNCKRCQKLVKKSS